jgi:hypothetical protein
MIPAKAGISFYILTGISATLSVFWQFESLDGDLKGKSYSQI